MNYEITTEDYALRLGAAVLCGFIIGIEREIKHKNAGLRTFLLVCLGAAGFTLIVLEIFHDYIKVSQAQTMIDPTRIIQGIITGIGFLGGGAILQSKHHVSGTATGASIWVSGAIGVACGYGFYTLAMLITLYTFAVLAIIGYLRGLWWNKYQDKEENEQNSS